MCCVCIVLYIKDVVENTCFKLQQITTGEMLAFINTSGPNANNAQMLPNYQIR